MRIDAIADDHGMEVDEQLGDELVEWAGFVVRPATAVRVGVAIGAAGEVWMRDDFDLADSVMVDACGLGGWCPDDHPTFTEGVGSVGERGGGHVAVSCGWHWFELGVLGLVFVLIEDIGEVGGEAFSATADGVTAPGVVVLGDLVGA